MYTTEYRVNEQADPSLASGTGWFVINQHGEAMDGPYKTQERAEAAAAELWELLHKVAPTK